MNDLKEIRVTESYLGFDQEDRGCQNDEPMYNCTTRHYLETLLKECECLPLNIRLFPKVCLFQNLSKDDLHLFYSRKIFALHQNNWIV